MTLLNNIANKMGQMQCLDVATCRDCRNLQAPTGAESRHAARKEFAHEFDLPERFRFAFVDIERRTGHRDAVVIGEADSGWKRRLAVGSLRGPARCRDVRPAA